MCVKSPPDKQKPTTFVSLNFLVHFSICETVQIWICIVSVYDIDNQSQPLCLPLNISQIQIIENYNILMALKFREPSIATSDSFLPACGPLIVKQGMPH